MTIASAAPADITTENPRLAWDADVRAVLDAVLTHPALPLPYISRARVSFYLMRRGDRAVRDLAEAEAALSGSLGVTFTPPAELEGVIEDYVLRASMGALEIELRACGAEVAARRVTGQKVTDVVELVRLPLEDEGEAAA